MMVGAAPLLLLLLQLMGSQGQGPEEMNLQKGRTLILRCRYNFQIYEMRWKTWCKWRENGRVCDRLITKNSVSLLKIWDPRASLQDDPNTGIITITMSDLSVKDSGIYSCGIYSSVSNTIEVIRRISLQISPDPNRSSTNYSQPISPVTISSSPFIQVLCGLIVTKGLVFTALVILLSRCRCPGKGKSHLELSQHQNGLG
ncbi:natural cytotoxicity triggering receptor 2-like isoform X2 [Dromiciops gliroides]|uniref:natural cytotoxicity triggering receptor 2-like isoform X2 n=1 Tax=Dromiciops gliroides TaxID=33562 RepID=UPI001CC805C9|nr:natural cytotoxicity triggering receptor 2-like isoform X2 [Dromiciops gliroides]